MTLEPGSTLHDRYRIESQLGKGGMGAVYRAYDLTLEIQVAVKENLNESPEAERQFRREASLLATLRHPNLPRVTDHFILEGRQYLVMDYIEGVDLETRARDLPPTASEVMSWADTLCDALIYLHSRTPPVIHRDIKPANIKLQPDGNLMLVDFGIAKVFDRDQTATGARGLTPGYSPPEQYGSAHTDHRSDQFSLAATLYNLLTGQRPADSIDRLFHREELTPLKSLNPSVPDSFANAIMQALRLDPSERFEDMVSFRAALKGESQAKTIRLPDQAVRPQSGPGAETVLSSPAPAAEGISPPSERRGRGASPWLIGGILASILLLLGGGGGAFLFARMGGFGFSGPPTATDALPPAPPTDTPTATQTSTPTASASPTSTPSPAPIPSVTPTITKTPVTLGGGGRIAFASDRGEGRWLQIWTMNPDGSDPRQLTFGPGDKSQPRWSPNGQRLAFVSEADRNAEIYVMNANGEHLVNLTNHPSEDTGPAWSPDGTRMAFTTTRVAEVRQVFLMNLDCPSPSEPCSSSNPHNITVGYAVEYSPVWAPSGFEPPPWMPEDQPIAVSASINDAPGRLVFRSADGGEPVWFDLQDRLIGVDHLDWSEDGEFLLFTWKQPGVFEIYSVPIADRGNRWNKLTNSLGNQRPSFSPDGRWIVFMSTRDQNPEIYVMTVSGANQTNITEHTSRDIDPDWAPAPDD